MRALQKHFSESLHAFRNVFRNPDLRRVELAWAGSEFGDWAAAIALAVFAYESGGAAAVGLVGLIRLLPAALAAPFTALLGDRYPRQRVMVVADLARSVALIAAAAATSLDAPVGVIYVLAAFVSVVATAFRPAQAALLPSLARSPEELTASNVASSTIESISAFAGPAFGGLLLAVTSTSVAFATTAGTFLASALLLSRISAARQEETIGAAREPISRAALAGFRTIAHEPRLRLLVGLFGAQTLVAGAFSVLIVPSALELLELGNSGVGYLYSALGVGGILGAGAALALIGRRRLAVAFGLGVVFWGAPIALIAATTSLTPALVLVAVVGLANTIVDVAALTLLQRAVPDEVLARVFGVLESLVLAMAALGAILAPVLIAVLGLRGALVATGVFLPLLIVLMWRRLASLDADAPVPERQLGLLRSLPVFAPLPGTTLEHLAASLLPIHVAAGTQIVRQGDPGDRFYVVAEGELEVTVDGEAGPTIGSGDHFGEIALLQGVPRTATVTAITDAELYALERDEFVSAVTGHPASAEAADAVIATRLASVRPRVASL